MEVEGDRVRLKQVVVNLLDNAIKYTPEGGRVTVGVQCADRQAQLEISDTGPGITTSDLPHVFERFFRADQVRLGSIEGAGLGLSIVQSICTAHGGFVNAENHAERWLSIHRATSISNLNFSTFTRMTELILAAASKEPDQSKSGGETVSKRHSGLAARSLSSPS